MGAREGRGRPDTDRIVIAPEERRRTVVDIIAGAKRQLTLSLFRCKDDAIFDALSAAVQRGVVVDALVTSRAKGERTKVRKLHARLQALGVRVHAYGDPVVKYHAKYLVADDGPAVVASLNFTRKCFEKTWDALVVTHDPDVVRGLRELMAADAAGSPIPDLAPRLIIGPERARRQFAALINSAEATIQLMDAKLADPDLVTLLKERRAQGIDVRICSARKIAGRRSHGKFLLIDGRRVPVVLDDCIMEQESSDSASIAVGCYSSDIYIVPFSARGGTIRTLFWQYQDYRQGVIPDATQARAAPTFFWSDNGVFLWGLKAPDNWCLEVICKTEPRLILRTPQLAGRLQNVVYCPLQHTDDALPSQDYWTNGGVSTGRPFPSPFSEWNLSGPGPGA